MRLRELVQASTENVLECESSGPQVSALSILKYPAF